MILDSFANADRYAALNPRLPAAFEFIRAFEREPLPNGAYPVCDGVVATVKRHVTMLPSNLRYETHNAAIDLQYIAQGTEVMGWRSVPITDDHYDRERDVTFYDGLIGRPIAVDQGSMILFLPGDAHQPCGADGAPAFVTKLFIKVAI